MEFKKYSLVVLSILMILFVFVSSASAADTNEANVLSSTDESVTQNDVLSVDNNVESNGNVLKENEGTYSELKDEIGSGGNKTLNKSFYKYDGSSEVITISESGTIDGNGAVIDMAGSNIGAFLVNEEVNVIIKNLVIKNSAIKNSDESYGGAISFSGYGTVVNCTFINNTALNGGGAIYLSIDGNISDCTFVNNSAVGSESMGGAICILSGHTTFYNSFFENNAAVLGGAIYSGDLDPNCVDTFNCSFVNNSAVGSTGSGGAIFSIRDIKAFHSIFISNTASEFGGAINTFLYNGACEVDTSVFVNNTASYGDDMSFAGSFKIGDCWFGLNNPDWNNSIIILAAETYVPSSHAILNATSMPLTPTSSRVTLKYAFYKNSTGEAMSDMPIRPIELSSDAGFFENASGYLINGEFSTEFTSNTPGIHVITAKVDNEEIKLYINVTLTPTNIIVNTTSLNLTVGHSDIIGANLTPSKAGNVSFNSSDENIVTVDENGVVTAIAEGKANIIAWFGGDDTYAADNVTISVIVNEDLIRNVSVENVTKYFSGPETLIVNVTNSKGEPVYGELVLITVDAITYNKTTDENGLASLNLTLNPGSYDVNTTVGNVSVNSTVTIFTTLVSVSIQSGLRTVTYSAYFTDGEGTPLKNGTEVKIDIDGKEYLEEISGDKGQVSIDLVLNSGYYTVTVINPETKEKKLSHINITAIDPNIKIEADKITVGENATVTVTLPDDVTGNVTIGNETIPLVNATATAVLTNLPVGNTTVPVTYSGDKYYNSAQSNVNITVNPKSDLNISAGAKPITVGEVAIVVVTGLENATGNVSVNANGKTYTAPIENCEATVNVPNLTENTTVIVNYAGDNKYNAATTTVNITVNPKGKENATISIDAPSEAPEGDNVTVTVTLPEDATGNITIGNETIPLINGTASAVLTNLPAGNTTVPITYSGDEKYNPIETEINITVIEDKSINVKAPDVTKYYHGPERFVVNVTDSKGNALANKSVSISINGVTYNRTTNGNGTCSLALNLDANVYNVTTTVENTTVNSVVTIFTTVNGTDVIKVFRNDTQYYATFLDANGKYLAEGSAVRFNINGVMYDRKVTGGKGLAKLNINLQQGEYVITATNLNTSEMSSNNITVLSRIIENNDLTKFYRNASQYTVKIIGDDGKVVGAGVDVTFNVNGVLYTRQTNASGIAKLNINLNAGNYIITAECKKCKVSNNIKVLPVLTAQDMVKKYGAPDQFVATLVDGQGNPYARQTVQFNINGVLYNRVTDSAGQAKLNIRLMPGQYIITSSYNGCNIANKITVQG